MNNSEELKYQHLIELGKLREYNGDKKIVNLDNLCSSEKEYNATTLHKSKWLEIELSESDLDIVRKIIENQGDFLPDGEE